MAIDFLWLNAYMPIISFFFVFVVIYAILSKTEILGENQFTNFFISFVFAIVFVTFSPGIDFVSTLLPWVVILTICIFFVLVIIGMSQNKVEDIMKPGFAWVLVAILVVMFLISAIIVFNPVLKPYLPGPPDTGGEDFLLSVKHFLYSEKFLGAVLLLIIAAATSWVLTKSR
jgi:hypothetical protein